MQGDVGEGHYWPLTYSTFWLEHKLWGLAPTGYHVVNILLHFANTTLLWRLLLRLCVPGAWLVAAVFAVHPLHVESVAWIIERKDVLSALFYLTAVLGWIRFVEEPRRERYILVLVLFVAGLLSKSIVVTLPATLLIYHWWQWGRVTQSDLIRLMPFFLVALCITAADLSFYTSRELLSLGYSPIERVLIAARALWFYAGKLLWPTELAVIYPLWDIGISDPLAWVYVVACIAVAALLWFGRERLGRGPLAGVAFFAVTLSPVLGFVDYGYMQFSLVADRFQYLAGIGVMAVLIGSAVHGVGRLANSFRMGACGLAVVVLALFGVMTWQQAGIYRDEISLFSHIVSFNPEARGAHLSLALLLAEEDRAEEARAAARIAVEQRPYLADAHYYSLGEILRKQGHHEEAIASYRVVLEIDPEHALAYAGMGDALFQLERYEEALASLTQAISLQSDLPMAARLHVLMGQASQELGRTKVAAEQYERALLVEPHNTEALDRLAFVRFWQKRYEEALDLYRILIDIGYAKAQNHTNMAASLFYLGRTDEAIENLERALSLDPNLESAQTYLKDMRRRH
ncbi:MAG: tetratricopeptide repeat protein [Gemmatimonadota bacterium]|nr:tetratricopeptide repeat protein [Gemmatimonadota bacterium]